MKKILFVAFACLTLVGCAYAVDEPFQNSSNALQGYIEERGMDVSNLKQGSDCQTRVFFLGPFGSKSVVKAARKGGIRKVVASENGYHDYIIFNLDCVEVYGE